MIELYCGSSEDEVLDDRFGAFTGEGNESAINKHSSERTFQVKPICFVVVANRTGMSTFLASVVLNFRVNPSFPVPLETQSRSVGIIDFCKHGNGERIVIGGSPLKSFIEILKIPVDGL
jgi:hypothetical protein